MRKIVLVGLILVLVLGVVGCQEKEYSVSGTVVDRQGEGVAGVKLSFGKFGTATTDEAGEWSKSQLIGPVTIKPAKENWKFEPSKIEVEESDEIQFEAEFVSGIEQLYETDFEQKKLDQLKKEAEKLKQTFHLTIQEYVDTYFKLGDAYYYFEEFEAAQEAYQEGLKMETANFEYQLKLANLEFKAGELKPAKERLLFIEENCAENKLVEIAGNLLAHPKLREVEVDDIKVPNRNDYTLYLVEYEGVLSSLTEVLAARIAREFNIKVEILERDVELADDYRIMMREDLADDLLDKTRELIGRRSIETAATALEINLEEELTFEEKRKIVLYIYRRLEERPEELKELFTEAYRQYDGETLLEQLSDKYEVEINKNKVLGVLAIMKEGLYQEDYNYLFGLASPRKRVGVLAYPRFFLGANSIDVVIDRMAKQGFSSVGHILNLPQCSVEDCARAYANSLAEHDKKGNRLSSECRANLKERYQELDELYSGYSLSGRVVTNEGQGIAGVTLDFGEFGTAETDDSGYWSKSSLQGPVEVTPFKEGYNFKPESVKLTKVEELVFVDAATIPYQLQGKVVDTKGGGVSGVKIDLGKDYKPVVTNNKGEWSVEVTGEVEVKPRNEGLDFYPEAAVINPDGEEKELTIRAIGRYSNQYDLDKSDMRGRLVVKPKENYSPENPVYKANLSIHNQRGELPAEKFNGAIATVNGYLLEEDRFNDGMYSYQGDKLLLEPGEEVEFAVYHEIFGKLSATVIVPPPVAEMHSNDELDKFVSGAEETYSFSWEEVDADEYTTLCYSYQEDDLSDYSYIKGWSSEYIGASFEQDAVIDHSGNRADYAEIVIQSINSVLERGNYGEMKFSAYSPPRIVESTLPEGE